MQKHEREVLKIVRTLTENTPITFDFDQWAGSTHRKLILSAPDGRRRQTVVGSSPTNRDHTIDNVRKWVRRTLKELSHD